MYLKISVFKKHSLFHEDVDFIIKRTVKEYIVKTS